MKPVKGTYKQTGSYGEPYLKSVLDKYPVLRKAPWNGKCIGWEYAQLSDPTIYSCVPGKITYIGKDNFGANVIWEDTDYGYRLLYAHLSSFGVKKGQRVEWQTPLGKVGATGMATGVHLALQAKKSDKWVDPRPMIDKQPPNPKVTLYQIKGQDEVYEHIPSRAEAVKRFGKDWEKLVVVIDPCAAVRRELEVRTVERNTEREAKESYAKRLAQVEKDNIALNEKAEHYGGRIDDLLKKMGQTEKDNKRLMENSANALVEKEKRIKELESSVDELTADASIGKSIIEIGVAVRKLVGTIWGRVK